MAVERYRLRVNPATGEFEIEGSQEFVEKYWDELRPLIARSPVPPDAKDVPLPPVASSSQSNGGGAFPKTFGEYLNQFGKLNGADQMLVAGRFQQATNKDDTFTTNEAGSLLAEQGVKLSNPSQANRANVKGKKTFKVKGRSFRVSPQGTEYIEQLRQQATTLG